MAVYLKTQWLVHFLIFRLEDLLDRIKYSWNECCLLTCRIHLKIIFHWSIGVPLLDQCRRKRFSQNSIEKCLGFRWRTCPQLAKGYRPRISFTRRDAAERSTEVAIVVSRLTSSNVKSRATRISLRETICRTIIARNEIWCPIYHCALDAPQLPDNVCMKSPNWSKCNFTSKLVAVKIQINLSSCILSCRRSVELTAPISRSYDRV